MIQTRFATRNDTEALLPLYRDLGYPANYETLHHRLTLVLARKDYFLILAEINNVIVGFAGFSVGPSFERDGDLLRILVLSVSKSCHRQGIGTHLLNSIKAWCLDHGVQTIAVNSGNRPERVIAHGFYEQYGFVKKSSGFIYEINNTQQHSP